MSSKFDKRLDFLSSKMYDVLDTITRKEGGST
nr:MAG TPA: hypothetical protein [Caudoviricetes sp.]